MLNSLDNLVECASVSSRVGLRKILAATAVAWMTTVGAASATTISGTYSISYQAIGGNGPTSYTEPNSSGLPNVGSTFGNFTTGNLTSGVASQEFDFFTINPNNSSSGCPGSGCGVSHEGSHYYYTASGTLTVQFTFTNLTVLSGSTTSDTGLYQAKYGGAAISPCALASGGSGPSNDTDCITWNGSGNPDVLVVNLKDASNNYYTLDISLYDAEDWSITPGISFLLTNDPSPTPLPGALPLFVSGSGLLGFLGWRRQKRNAKAA